MIVRSIVPLCDRTHISLFQLFHIPVLAQYAAACERAPLTEPQCVFAIDRNLVAIEQNQFSGAQTATYLRICVCAIDLMCLRSSAPQLAAPTDPRQCICQCLFFIFYFFYFFYFLFFVCLIISFSLIIYCLCLFLFIY